MEDENNYQPLYEISGLLMDKEMDQTGIENAVRQLLAAFGEDPDRTGLERTPTRVA